MGDVSAGIGDAAIIADWPHRGASLKPFFSVVIPVYNRAQVLGRALGSVLAQSYQDFEIVVVDDGSVDNPMQIVADIGDARVRYIRQRNAGGGAARNHGIDVARGHYIAFLDSDDRFQPHHLEAMKSLLAGRTNILGYAPVITDRGGGRSVIKPLRGIRPGEHMAEYLLCDRGFIPTMTMVAHADIARKVRFPEQLRSAEDTDFAIRLFLEGCEFVMAPEPGAVWLDVHDEGRSSANGRNNLGMIEWIERLRPRISNRAYLGCYGWAIAKSVAKTSRWKALRLYLTALVHGCYRMPVAVVVFLQIFLSDHAYRWLSDTAIGWCGPSWDARWQKAFVSSTVTTLPGADRTAINPQLRR